MKLYVTKFLAVLTTSLRTSADEDIWRQYQPSQRRYSVTPFNCFVQQRRCGDTPSHPLSRAAETLRCHTLSTAVACSRDVAATHPLNRCRVQQRRCGVTPSQLLPRAAETLRCHTLSTAVACSRDVAAAHPLNCCCVQQRRCGVTPSQLLSRAAETLRRHTLLTAVACSRDIAVEPSGPSSCSIVEYIVPAPAVFYSSPVLVAEYQQRFALLTPVVDHIVPAPAASRMLL